MEKTMKVVFSMDEAYKRHDIADNVWALLFPHLPGQPGQWGGIAADNRKFLNGVFWILRTDAPWLDFTLYYGKYVRIFITADTTADCRLGEPLVNAINALALLADLGYECEHHY